MRANPYQDVPSVPAKGAIDIRSLIGEPRGGVELEIGFGRGHFLLDRAAALPTTSFFGLETRRKWVHVAAERALRRGIANVTVLHGDVRAVLPRLAPDGCLERVFVHFPDPWWKARHAKRLVLTRSVVSEVVRLLLDHGELFIQTDVDFRFAAYVEVMGSFPELQAVPPLDGSAENPFSVRSLRERRCLEVGLPVYRLLLRRRPRGTTA